MNRLLPLALALFFLPVSVSAATPFFETGSSVLLATSTTGNRYAAGGSITLTAPVSGDLTAIGGSVMSESAITGDALLAGGSVNVAGPIAGDLRVAGGRITIDAPVGNDLVAFGGSVADSGGAKNVFIAGAEVTLSGGARGPVTIYANNVALSGIFTGDVTIIASGRVALLPGTVINGSLNYQSPEAAKIDSTAQIDGQTHYTSTSYLPGPSQTHFLALASFGIFLFFRILGALILVGLLAGLFPDFAQMFALRARAASARRILLSILLGVGVMVTAPVLSILLTLTFLGIGLALLLFALYFIFCILAFVYSAVVIGAYLARYLFKREQLRVSDTIFGMLILFLLWSVPIIGGIFMFLLFAYTLGSLCYVAYRFAFPHEVV